jgi:hypothetical protein
MVIRNLGGFGSLVDKKLFIFLQHLVHAGNVWLSIGWQQNSTVAWEKPGVLQNSLMAETYMPSPCY